MVNGLMPSQKKISRQEEAFKPLALGIIRMHNNNQMRQKSLLVRLHIISCMLQLATNDPLAF